MVESSDDPSLLDRTRSSPGPAHAASQSFRASGTHRPGLKDGISVAEHSSHETKDNGFVAPTEYITGRYVPENRSKKLPPPAPPPAQSGQGEESTTLGSAVKEEKQTLPIRFYKCCKAILLSSWLNVLLVFVPVGIATDLAGVDKTIVFAMNAIAIIPLAGLLSYATETVASDLGDTIGSLMNVTFGNAVELIIL